MDELRQAVASNLIRLRQAAGLTQAELGEKLNYSDKSVSKWERAEAVPDAYVLLKLSQIFGVTVDDLLHEESAEPAAPRPRYSRFRPNVVTLVALIGIWTLALLVVVTVWIVIDRIVWQIFVCAVPVSLITLLVLNSVWHRGRRNMIIVICLVASLVALLYLLLLPKDPWQIFLILPPAEILVILCFFIPRHIKK